MSNFQRIGRLALFSGAIGILAVGLLIAALAAPTPSPASMRRETTLFAWQNAAVILQALGMIPVTLGLHHLGKFETGVGRPVNVALGLIAQLMLIVTSALLFTDTVSDMLYMAPVGLVGLWLLAINRRSDRLFSRGLVWTGRVAGAGLMTVGVGFVIYGVFVAPAVFIRPLSAAEIDAQSLTLANLVAHICMAAGTLFGRIVYPAWTIFLGLRFLGNGARPTLVTTQAGR
jgi:hypothetical protein